jgi:phosphatidylinositol-3-phosphatase
VRRIRSPALATLLLLTASCAAGGGGGKASPSSDSGRVPSSINPPSDSSPTRPRTEGAPPIVVIVMENKEYSEVVGSDAAPYINGTLIPRGRLFTNYTAVAHPSLPNYLAMTGGDTLGKSGTDAISSGELGADNLFHQLEEAGIAWRSFQESMPMPCFGGAIAGSEPDSYVLKHDPAMAFANVVGAPACQDVVPLTQMDPGRLPAFSFLTPNECHDMHSCEVSAGDAWLAGHIPALLAGGALVVVTFDEGITDASGGGRVLSVEVGPGVPIGVRDGGAFNHLSLLAALERWFGLPRLAGAKMATPLPL